MARVSTYLNFSRQTEEAFRFYKTVFGSELNEAAIRRFRDIPQQEGMLPVDGNDKELIVHIELTITGGHVLMGTDAPETMGFNLVSGNNIYINLEPDSKEETTRLFNALSQGGKVTMALQTMFWGGYYGTCSDKYGINWMFNYNGTNN